MIAPALLHAGSPLSKIGLTLYVSPAWQTQASPKRWSRDLKLSYGHLQSTKQLERSNLGTLHQSLVPFVLHMSNLPLAQHSLHVAETPALAGLFPGFWPGSLSTKRTRQKSTANSLKHYSLAPLWHATSEGLPSPMGSDCVLGSDGWAQSEAGTKSAVVTSAVGCFPAAGTVWALRPQRASGKQLVPERANFVSLWLLPTSSSA